MHSHVKETFDDGDTTMGRFLPFRPDAARDLLCSGRVRRASWYSMYRHFKSLTDQTMQVSDGSSSRINQRRILGHASALLMLFAVACGGASDMTGPGNGGGTTTPPAVASIAVSPATANLLLDVADTATLGTATITPTLKDGSGNVLSGPTVTWSSSAESIAKVSSAGVVTAVGIGTASITATSEGKSGQVSVTVTRPVIDTITVTPTSSSIKAGASETLEVTLLDAQGHVLSNRLIAPRSDEPSIVTVSGGTVTGVAAGTGTVRYQSENNKVTVATITVTQ